MLYFCPPPAIEPRDLLPRSRVLQPVYVPSYCSGQVFREPGNFLLLSLGAAWQAQQRERREASSVEHLMCARPCPGHFAAIMSSRLPPSPLPQVEVIIGLPLQMRKLKVLGLKLLAQGPSWKGQSSTFNLKLQGWVPWSGVATGSGQKELGCRNGGLGPSLTTHAKGARLPWGLGSCSGRALA